MILDIEGLGTRSPLRSVINRKLGAAFRQRRLQPMAVRIDFTDENGPKGGVGMRCGLTVELPRRRKAVHVEHRAETRRLAFDAALAGLERQFERERGRKIAESRRPKKYYLARRLMDEPVDETPALPVEEARARRRTA